MAATSRIFVAPTSPGTGTVDLATVPDGKQWLVRGLYVVNLQTSTTAELIMRRNGTSASDALLVISGLISRTTYHLDPWWVLEEGDVLKTTKVTGTYTISVYGYEFPSP